MKDKKELITVHNSLEEVKEVLEKVKQETVGCLACGKRLFLDSDRYFTFNKQYEILYYCSKECLNEFDFGERNFTSNR